jgi:hypothetical protein
VIPLAVAAILAMTASPRMPVNVLAKPTVASSSVAGITHKPTGRTVHLYLEVDMGTETLASPRRSAQDVRAKILNYKACFRGNHYKRYEQIWRCSLRGFRLLILAYNSQRAFALCRLVKDMAPSDFVWVTASWRLQSEGAWAAIWASGGQPDMPRRSILGSLLPNPCPSPADLAEADPPADHAEAGPPS